MKARMGLAALCGLVALLIVGGTLAHRLIDKRSPSLDAVRPVVIDPGMGETFTPEPAPDNGGYLTADQVWQKWDHEPVPDSIPATFGRLTMYTGPPGEPGVLKTQSGTPVWAFQEASCVGSFAWRSASSSGGMAIAQRGGQETCTTWWLFDAKTGVLIDGHSVPDSPTASPSTTA